MSAYSPIPKGFKLQASSKAVSIDPHKMLDHVEYSHSSEAETLSSTTTPPAAMRKKRSTKNKRRFSDEQIKSLESMFQTESRLEPIKKLQLARELGLQPRQVAIWFQNKRARWKSKQLERDYSILRANYNCLASRFDALKKEKQALLLQVRAWNTKLFVSFEVPYTILLIPFSTAADAEWSNKDATRGNSRS